MVQRRKFSKGFKLESVNMALFKFTKAILAGEKIPVFSYGKRRRDFTCIDDIVEGAIHVLDEPARPKPDWSGA